MGAVLVVNHVSSLIAFCHVHAVDRYIQAHVESESCVALITCIASVNVHAACVLSFSKFATAPEHANVPHAPLCIFDLFTDKALYVSVTVHDVVVFSRETSKFTYVVLLLVSVVALAETPSHNMMFWLADGRRNSLM